MDHSQRASMIYKCVVAFQHFAGKPLRALDAFNAISDEAINRMDGSLRVAVDELRKEDRLKWPELHKLADDVERTINMK